MNTKLVTVQFNYAKELRRTPYDKLYAVFKKSIEQNAPLTELVELRTTPPEVNPSAYKISFSSNTYKLKLWCDYLETATDPVVFADCDMVCLADPATVFEEFKDFDIGYTERHAETGRKLPINGGIVFARPTPETKAFFKRWYEVNCLMLSNRNVHNKYHEKYGGINQSAFGYLLENPSEHTAKLQAFPTRIYNAVDCDWHLIKEDTMFVHYKSDLRRRVLGGSKDFTRMQRAIDLWHYYAKML
jgi:hypothetical protein